MSQGVATRPPAKHRLARVAMVLGAVVLLALPVLARRDPVRLSFVSSTNALTGVRTAYLCLTNDSPKHVIFLSSGGLPCYQLVEYLTLSTNPVTKLVTNYNQDAFYYVAPGRLAPHSGVVFPVVIPPAAGDTTVIVNYFPPDNLIRDWVDYSRELLGRKPALPGRAYSNLTLKPPVN